LHIESCILLQAICNPLHRGKNLFSGGERFDAFDKILLAYGKICKKESFLPSCKFTGIMIEY